MLAVLTILAMIAAVSIPMLMGSRRQPSAEDIAHQMRNLFWQARLAAIANRRTNEVHLNLQERKIEFPSSKTTIAFPPDLKVEVLVGQELISPAGNATLLFFKDGASSGARFHLKSPSASAELVVPWLTGVPILSEGPN
jgi:general secretion pathway protein H